MRPNNFPQASDFKVAVQDKQDVDYQLKVASQRNAIANNLETFYEKCNSDGYLKVSEIIIGTRIYPENHKIITESGWRVEFNDYEKKWVFSIM